MGRGEGEDVGNVDLNMDCWGKKVMSIPLFSPGDGPLVVVVSSSKIGGKGGREDVGNVGCM